MAATLDGFGHVPPQNETAIAQAVSQHPVAVAVCCGDYIDNWHAYTGGLFDIPNTGELGHCNMSQYITVCSIQPCKKSILGALSASHHACKFKKLE